MFFLLADDHALFREGMTHILKACFSNAQVTQVGNWPDARVAMMHHEFSLVLVDLNMPNSQISWEAELQQMLALSPCTPVCVVSASEATIDRQRVYELGAAGFFHKSMSPLEIQQNITQLLAGVRVFPPMPVEISQDSPLTTRQQDIMDLLSKGYSNKEIAQKLQLSEGTVKRHFSNIFSVLGVKNRVEALRSMQKKSW